MNTGATVRIALRALRRNKLRSALTALGIIIGVSALIAMLAVGHGAKAQVEAQIASLGENVIQVAPGSVTKSAVKLGLDTANILTIEDAEAIRDEIPNVVAVGPELKLKAQVVSGSRNWSASVYGEWVDFFRIRQWPVVAGDLFTEQDERGATKVAVLGQLAAQELFGTDDPIGQSIRIMNVPFTVMGVLAAKGASTGDYGQDDNIIIPLSTMAKQLIGKQSGLRRISVQAASVEAIGGTEKNITQLLLDRHRMTPGKDDEETEAFKVTSQLEIAEKATETSRTMTVLLGIIASVSLMVGGIGIMNIMLVSVTERTREIGIRMAVGACERDILRQFLAEAFTLSALGGLIGISLGVVTAHILTAVAKWPTLISVESVVLAFLFSAAVGIFFGYYPARKAAHLDPIDALRFE